jgi:hypothetical protein
MMLVFSLVAVLWVIRGVMQQEHVQIESLLKLVSKLVMKVEI